VTASGTRLSRNGKQYPAAPLTRQERGQAIRLAHLLVHDRGLSIRHARQVMIEDYQIRRSIGSIARDLAGYVCPLCPDADS
jgi:hypothetical protein